MADAGLMFACFGCCCGHTNNGAARISRPATRRVFDAAGLQGRVRFAFSECLGPCSEANVVFVYLNGRPLWFRRINTPELFESLLAYVRTAVEAPGATVARGADRAFVLVDRRRRRPRARLRSDIMDYADFRHLTFESKPNGVLVVTINRPEVLNAANARLHWEFTQIWPVVDADPKTRVVVVTGAGKAFSAGGDLSLVEDMAGNPDALTRTMREASDLVYNMINLDKPVVSAINGVAVGAGLVVALMADVSIIAETARFTDGHTRLGVAAGDHAAILWPLLCGMAKAKYYLLTADFIDGREAERIGLVTMCLPPDQVMPKALDVADRLARGSQISIRWTKRALNNWLRQAGPIFDQSLALEMLSFSYPDVREGVKAIREKRTPIFPSAK